MRTAPGAAAAMVAATHAPRGAALGAPWRRRQPRPSRTAHARGQAAKKWNLPGSGWASLSMGLRAQDLRALSLSRLFHARLSLAEAANGASRASIVRGLGYVAWRAAARDGGSAGQSCANKH
eukprot:352934-Chlamydomonas_euryale.AAC.2